MPERTPLAAFEILVVVKKDGGYVVLPIKFQLFLSLWLKDHNVVLAAPTGWRFQPLLRFWPGGAVLILASRTGE